MLSKYKMFEYLIKRLMSNLLFRDDDSLEESSSQDDLGDGDDEYGKPKSSLKKRKTKTLLKKKRRKKKLGGKASAVVKDEFLDLPEFERPNGGWVQEFKFTCNRCNIPGENESKENKEPRPDLIGFEASVDHMIEKHGNSASPDKQFQVSILHSHMNLWFNSI